MLLHNTERNRHPAKSSSAAQPPARTSIESERKAVSALANSLLRDTRLIGATTLIGASIVTAFVSFGLTPQYLATTTILVDSRKTLILKDQEVIGRPGTENSAIESEAEMLAAPSVLRRVAEQLSLDQDKEFTNAPAGLFGWLKWLLMAPLKMVSGSADHSAAADPFDLRDPTTALHRIAGVNRVAGSEAVALALREPGRLIDKLCSNYNRILMDSSPLLPVADQRFLVNIDGVVLIVASEQTSRSAVQAALQETPGIEAKILGTVMNRVQDDFARSYPEYGSVYKVA
jgi:hypothetical protein